MARPKKDPDKRMNIGMIVKLDKETADKLNQMSEYYNISKSEIVRKLIKSKYLNQSIND